MNLRYLVVTALLLLILACCTTSSSTKPFLRSLYYTQPPITGSDVFILQNLLLRSEFVTDLNTTSEFDEATKDAVQAFQVGHNLSKSDGTFVNETAKVLLKYHLYDNYVDDGQIPTGYHYKVYIPVYANRSIETLATLFDANNKPIFQFRVRTRGQSDSDGSELNCLSSDGATPTGLMAFDLNSPEQDPISFGPYPVNRVVEGLAGNAAVVLQNNEHTIRNGILMHTGEWANWTSPQNMPNSHGCVHGWPTAIETIWDTLVKWGVQVRNNTDGALPYPYQPQGILSIEQIG